MFPSVTLMDTHQDFFAKLGSESHLNDSSDHMVGVSGDVDDDPFNDSGGDFFDKFMAEEAAMSAGNNNNSRNNGSISMLDSGINAESLLDEALQKSSGSLSLEGKDMEDGDGARMVKADTHFSMEEGDSGQNQPWSNFGSGPLSSGIKKSDSAPAIRNWFQTKSSSLPKKNSVSGNVSQNPPLNSTLDATPLNVSLGGGGSSIAATLRRKGSNAKPNAPKTGSVIKATLSSSKMRSNKSDGLLARALKAKYNSSPNISKYNFAMSAIGGGTGNISGNKLFDGESSVNLNAVEEEGDGVHNASWGAVELNTEGDHSLFSQMLNKQTTGLAAQKNKSKLHTSVSASVLVRKQTPPKMVGAGSRSSMQDLLRLCKKQSKTQSLLRQSSAHSLLKQTSPQSLKGFSKKVDLSSLLPPQHTSSHVNNRKWLNSTEPSHVNSSNAKNNSASPSVSGQQGSIDTSSLLHQSCRLYPTTSAVVESALRIDPEAVRRAVPVTLEKGQSKKSLNVYGYPVNIALAHGGSMEVIKMLSDAGPDVLVQKDGTDGSGSLGIALMSKCDMPVVNMLVQANRDCVKVSDRRGNYPLHIATNYGLSLGIVKRLYAIYPKALQMRNFHSETPLDIAQRSTRCAEEVMNFLQSTAFSPLETSAHHMDDRHADDLEDGLDDIMETNF